MPVDPGSASHEFGRFPRSDRAIAGNRRLGTRARLVKARAYCQWGDALAAGPERNFQEAATQHLQAIKLAEPLAGDARAPIRREAKEVLLDAHLGVAGDIARGRWQQKQKVVPKWIYRAQALAEAMIASEKGAEDLRLRVGLSALAALAEVADVPDSWCWIDETVRTTKQLIEKAEDPARRQWLQWQLGLAADALEIESAAGRSKARLNMALPRSSIFGLEKKRPAVAGPRVRCRPRVLPLGTYRGGRSSRPQAGR